VVVRLEKDRRRKLMLVMVVVVEQLMKENGR